MYCCIFLCSLCTQSVQQHNITAVVAEHLVVIDACCSVSPARNYLAAHVTCHMSHGTSPVQPGCGLVQQLPIQQFKISTTEIWQVNAAVGVPWLLPLGSVCGLQLQLPFVVQQYSYPKVEQRGTVVTEAVSKRDRFVCCAARFGRQAGTPKGPCAVTWRFAF